MYVTQAHIHNSAPSLQLKNGTTINKKRINQVDIFLFIAWNKSSDDVQSLLPASGPRGFRVINNFGNMVRSPTRATSIANPVNNPK